MIKVSITNALMNKGAAHRYAQNLAESLSLGKQFWCFGSHGGFERNYEAMAANIRKIHVLLEGDKPWPANYSISERTCNNFLIYAHHLYEDDHFQILALISPDAHARVDAMLPEIIKLAEAFIELPLSELEKLKTYDA